MARDGQIIRPTGRIASIADINEANENRVPIDFGYHGDEPKRTWDGEGDGSFRPQPSLEPTAAFTAVLDGDTVSVDAEQSFDPEGSGLKITWDFGDGTVTSGAQSALQHTYTSNGKKVITLTVEDATGMQDAASAEVTVTAVA